LGERALVLQPLELLLPLPIETSLLFALTLVVRQRQVDCALIDHAEHQFLDERIYSLGASNPASRPDSVRWRGGCWTGSSRKLPGTPFLGAEPAHGAVPIDRDVEPGPASESRGLSGMKNLHQRAHAA
jgi:hypothetical protein